MEIVALNTVFKRAAHGGMRQHTVNVNGSMRAAGKRLLRE